MPYCYDTSCFKPVCKSCDVRDSCDIFAPEAKYLDDTSTITYGKVENGSSISDSRQVEQGADV